MQYYQAVRTYLEQRKSPYRAIVAFSGEHEFVSALIHRWGGGSGVAQSEGAPPDQGGW